jgi:hypothetical protein
MSPFRRLALITLLPLALCACAGEKKPSDQGMAAGEILEGSASDAMLPLDTVRSQAPLAPKAGDASGNKQDAGPEKPSDRPRADGNQ